MGLAVCWLLVALGIGSASTPAVAAAPFAEFREGAEDALIVAFRPGG
jgi:hypothetical protein